MTPLIRLVAVTGAVLGASALFVLEREAPEFSTARLVLVGLVGLVMVGAGLVASANGEDRIGVLVVLAGFSWTFERVLQAIPTGFTITIGSVLTGLWFSFLVHALVTFPSGRLTSRIDRGVVVAGYVINSGSTILMMLFLPFSAVGIPERNFLALFPDIDAARSVIEFSDRVTLAWLLVLLGLIVRKMWVASPPARRAYGATWAAGLVLIANLVVIVTAGLEIFDFRGAYDLWLEIVAGVAPVTLAASLFAIRVSEDRLVVLVAELETVGRGASLRHALRRALADPDLDIGYVRTGGEGWVDEVGESIAAPAATPGRSMTAIERGGKPIAALVHDAALLRNPERLRAAIGSAALAIDNERLKADLRAQLLDVRASRARIVEAGDRERRRVERNLHDGAQQRLVGLALTLRLAARRAGGHPELTELLDEAARELDDALGELRELSRGIHPAILTDTGLGGALETLAERPGVPVDLSIDLPDSLPDVVEVGAYYVVAEALANANKYAQASQVCVGAEVVDGTLRVTVSDRGPGGAASARGSGLEGLEDRVNALGGYLVVDSPPGAGTTITAQIPLSHPGAPTNPTGRT